MTPHDDNSSNVAVYEKPEAPASCPGPASKIRFYRNLAERLFLVFFSYTRSGNDETA